MSTTSLDAQKFFGRLTKPLVQLMDPNLTSMLNWRVKEDNLVLDANFVDDRGENQLTLRGLSRNMS